MADAAHIATDKKLEEMEKHLTEIYEKAAEDVERKSKSFFKRFEKKDEEKKKLVESGALPESEYLKWRKDNLMKSKKWKELKESISADLLHVHETAQAYINGKLAEIYALNYNSVGDYIESKIKGYSFSLIDAHTVKNLSTSKKSLLPTRKVAKGKAVAWDAQHINAEVLQGILQGKSIPKIAQSLRKVAEMDKKASIRTARTCITSAENKGRIDAMKEAEKSGIVIKKVWISTNDDRTRESHADLGGTTADIDEAFDGEYGDIMFPGDPSADPCEVYNCRCTLGTKIEGFKKR